MMTPREKAIDLIAKFQFKAAGINFKLAKRQALIAVDEIIESWPHAYEIEKEYMKGGAAVSVIRNIRSNIPYWQEVKQEIEAL